MRLWIFMALLATSACRVPYTNELANLTVAPFDIPPYGTSRSDLDLWFDEHQFAPGPRVFQAESELRRLPGAPLAYAVDGDRTWWLSRTQTLRDLCVTQKLVYYQLDAEEKLGRAILTSRSQC